MPPLEVELALSQLRVQRATALAQADAAQLEIERLERLARQTPPPAEARTAADGLWSVEETAAFLGVKKKFIYERTAEGAEDPIPVRRPGGRVLRFVPAEVKAWSERQQGPSQDRTTELLSKVVSIRRQG